MSDAPTPEPAPVPAGSPPPAPATFTQADLDRIIADRLARAKTEPPPDYAELREKAQKYDDHAAAQLSETERLTKAVADADARAAAAADRASTALQRSAIVAAAVRHGSHDPDAVFALLDRSAVTVADDGTVTGADDAVKALLTEKLYLVGKPPTPTPGGADSGVRSTPPAPDVDNMSMADYIAARKAGTIR